MDDPREAVRIEMVGQLADSDAQAARETYCRSAAGGFKAVGYVLYVGGYLQAADHVTGVSLVARMGGALGLGTCDLLDAGNPYAAAALTRQLVEVEYLLYTFAEDPDEAGKWLNSSRSQLRNRFSPSQMRARSGGRFSLGEYQTHCDLGGHPSPFGRALLADTPPLDPVRSRWADLGQHLERGWGYLMMCVEGVQWGEGMPDLSGIEMARVAWHERDPLAQRWAGPPTEGAATA